MNTTKRLTLGRLGSTCLLMLATSLRPLKAWAAEWNRAAFTAKDVSGAMRELAVGAAQDSRDILIKAPDIAEDGAVVPVDVQSRIPNTTQISILVEKNPNPLALSVNFSGGALAEAHFRLKFSESSPLRVLVKAGGKIYQAQREIRVTVGGCAN